MQEKILFFLTACEPSGDRLGAAMIQALRARFPEASFVGIAGPLMRAAGCAALGAQEDLAVMGFVAVLKQCLPLLKARRFTYKQALLLKPAAYIGLDAPDFNLPIEQQLKQHGIKTVHVNSPTVWAWRASRIKNIKKSVDLMLTLFPFETAIYEKNNIPVRYIGHPLATDIPRHSEKITARQKLNLDPTKKYLALMPGSRAADLRYLAPVFLQAAKLCLAEIPDLQILAPMVNERCATQFRAMLRKEQVEDLPIHFYIANAHQILQASDAVLIKSGTGTLEAMLCKTPMVVAYKMDAFSFWLVRKLVKIKHVSLPNILAGTTLVPELLQEQASKENLAAACLTLLKNPTQEGLLEQFDQLHQTLQQDSAHNAAETIAAVISPRDPSS